MKKLSIVGLATSMLFIGLVFGLFLGWDSGLGTHRGTVNAASKSFKDQHEIKQFTDKIMSALVADKIDRAFAIARKKWLLPQSEIQNLQNQTERQLKSVEGRFGEPLSYEVVSTQKRGKSLRRIIYLMKYEKHATLWRFYFYRPKNEWYLNTLYWNDKLQSLFSSAARTG